MTVSIVTVNFNNLEGLKKTRQSIISQTYTDWEWVVIDGGSTQGDITYIKQHSNEISYWCSEPDRGPYHAMNKGIAQTKGRYIIFLNSGDSFYDSEVLSHVFSKPHVADVVYGDWVQQFDHDEDVWMHAPQKMDLQFICSDNICHQAMFIKENSMKQSPYDESFKLYADWAKWIRFVLEEKTFEYVPYKICYFKMGGISNTHHDLIAKEHQRLHDEVIPRAVENLLVVNEELKSEINKLKTEKNSMHPLSVEVDKLIKEKSIYRKIIHMAIRIIHLIR
jgi:glycosyltransferase involved in cell wall biosynthesis